MSGWSVVRWTGALGLASIVLQLGAFILFLAAGIPPAFDDANKVLAYVKNAQFVFATAGILFFMGFSLFIAFNAGLRSIAATAAADHEWLATAVFALGITGGVMGLVSVGMALAVDSIAASKHAEAALVRLLFEASGVIGAAPSLVPIAVYLGAAGSLGATTRILPRWLALTGWIGSVLTLIAAFSAYGASDPSAFWSANGIVTILALLPLYVWQLGASVAFMRQSVARIYR